MVQRRIFSPEFKAEAVKLVNERGVAKSQAARDLGIHLSVLRYWIGKIGREVQAPHSEPPSGDTRGPFYQLPGVAIHAPPAGRVKSRGIGK
jgi:transposase-like protein